MKKNPLISILIPVYNVEKYLFETLSSIKNQTYTNFEVIIIDDNSSDSTFSIATHFSMFDNRFKVYKNFTRRYIAFSLNKSFEYSQGDYIARCDGDDIMIMDRLKTQLDYLIANNLDLVGNSFITINESGEYLNKRDFPSGYDLLKKQLNYISPISHIWLSKRLVYDTIGLYRLSSVEDYDFLFRVVNHGFIIDNIGGYYGMMIRIRSNNTVSLYGLAQRRLFNYAKNINKGRLVYDPLIEKQIIDSSLKGLIYSIHKFSDNISNRASKSRCNFLKYTLYFLSAIISFYRLQYFYRVIMSDILTYVHYSKK
ncbi:glycosyltransferase family 2 protein [Aquirufa antheringensis]